MAKKLYAIEAAFKNKFLPEFYTRTTPLKSMNPQEEFRLGDSSLDKTQRITTNGLSFYRLQKN